MGSEKSTALSIVIRTIDHATAGIRSVNAELAKATAPIKAVRSSLGALSTEAGLPKLINGFKSVAGVVKDVVGNLLSMGGVLVGVLGAAAAGMLHIAHEYADLGKTAARLGVGVDFLTQMRDAAERTGLPVESLDDGLQTFMVNLGKARQGLGRMASQVAKISTKMPDGTRDDAWGAKLLVRLKAAKGAAAATDILADAMARLTDPADRAALAMMTFGDPKFAPLISKGSKGLQEMRDHYAKLAGPQAEAAAEGMKVGEAMRDLHDATDGAKASLLVGLGPAIEVIVKKLTNWFVTHRGDIAAWADKVGKWLPGAIDSFVDGIEAAYERVKAFFVKVWDVIGPIVDKIAGAIETTKAAIGEVSSGSAFDGGSAFGGFGALGDAAKRVKLAPTLAPMDFVQQGLDQARGIKPRTPLTALDAVKGGIEQVNRSSAPAAPVNRPDISTQTRNVAAAAASNAPSNANLAKSIADALIAAGVNTKAEVTIKVPHAPKGTRVDVDKGSTAHVDINTGYQFSF